MALIQDSPPPVPVNAVLRRADGGGAGSRSGWRGGRGVAKVDAASRPCDRKGLSSKLKGPFFPKCAIMLTRAAPRGTGYRPPTGVAPATSDTRKLTESAGEPWAPGKAGRSARLGKNAPIGDTNWGNRSYPLCSGRSPRPMATTSVSPRTEAKQSPFPAVDPQKGLCQLANPPF